MSTEAGSASDGYLYACSYKQLEEDNRVCLVIQDKALILIRVRISNSYQMTRSS